MCISQQYYFVISIDTARKLNIYIFSPLVLILIRYIDASVKRIAFT